MKQYAKLRYEKVEGQISERQIDALLSTGFAAFPTPEPEWLEKSVRSKLRNDMKTDMCYLIAYEGTEAVGFVQYKSNIGKNRPLETFRTFVKPEKYSRGIAEKMTYYLLGYARHKLGKDMKRHKQSPPMRSLAVKMQSSPRIFFGKGKKPVGPHEKVLIIKEIGFIDPDVHIKPIRRRR